MKLIKFHPEILKVFGVLFLVFSIGSCGTTGGMNKQKAGTALGAIVGAGLGSLYKRDRKKGAMMGALLGGAAGNLLGRRLDEQERKLRQSLEKELATGEVEISRPGESPALVLSMKGTVLFESGESSLRPTAYHQLNNLVQAWQPSPEISVVVTGHTDNIGPLVANRDLSTKRAEAISSYLIRRGVPYEKMYLRGAGELSPISSNEDNVGRAQNRRVDLVFYPADSEPPQVVPIVMADTEPKVETVKHNNMDQGTNKISQIKEKDPSSVYAFNDKSAYDAENRQQEVKEKESVEPISPIRPASEIIKHI
jgi:outer membrane protein OmpA-like peptidoglycan-associated protein